MNQPKIKNVVRKGLIGLGVVALVALVGYVAVYRPLEIKKDRENYAKAEAKVEELAQKVESIIGKPSETESRKSCGRAHLKNARGPLLCTVGKSLDYRVTNLEQGNNLLQQVKAIYPGELRNGWTKDPVQNFIVDNKPGESIQTFYQTADYVSNLSCIFGYSYPRPTGSKSTDGIPETFSVDISCGGSAKAEHYPLQD